MNTAGRRRGVPAWWLAAVVMLCVSVPALACTEHRQDIGDIATIILVPGVVGDPEATAIACLKRYGYSPQRAGDVASKLPKGVVVRTNPAEATTPIDLRVENFQSVPVTYWVSSGQREVPNVVGDSVIVARIKLALKSFALGEITRRPSEGTAGRILEQSPEAGTTVPAEQSVDVVVSAEYPRVPDVIGQDERQATGNLADAGFEANNRGTVPSDKSAGFIVRTDPIASTPTRPGSTVNYWVTSGQNTVPDLRRLTREQAAERLASAGFVVGQAQERVDLGDPGVVVDQRPAAGEIAAVGTGVSVWISETLLVPDVVGKTEEQANAELVARNLSGVRDGEDASPRPRGEVLVTEPVAGTKVMDSATVHYRITSGSNTVPNVVGMTTEEAASKLDAEAFEPGQTTMRPAAGPPGIILEQRPAGGELLAVGQKVDVTVSSDLPTVPEIVGEARNTAEDMLQRDTFVPRLAGDEPSPKPRGIVLRADPPAGTKRDVGATVDYWIASGENLVPDLLGKFHQDARRDARQNGFKLDDPTYRYARESSNQVVEQTPAAGELLELDSSIAVVLGSNIPPVPNVVRMTPDEAMLALDAAGMTVAPLRKRYGTTGNGRVAEQQPAAGTVMPSDQPGQVTLTIASPLVPIMAGSTALLGLLAGAWWTQMRPWPWHWPPALRMRASLEAPGATWPKLGPLDHDPTRDVRMRVALIPGDTTFPEPLLIIRTEVRHD